MSIHMMLLEENKLLHDNVISSIWIISDKTKKSRITIYRNNNVPTVMLEWRIRHLNLRFCTRTMMWERDWEMKASYTLITSLFDVLSRTKNLETTIYWWFTMLQRDNIKLPYTNLKINTVVMDSWVQPRLKQRLWTACECRQYTTSPRSCKYH